MGFRKLKLREAINVHLTETILYVRLTIHSRKQSIRQISIYLVSSRSPHLRHLQGTFSDKTVINMLRLGFFTFTKTNANTFYK